MQLCFKSVCRRVLWLLPLILLMGLSQGVPGAWAQYDTFSGQVKFKIINKEINDKGKFATNTNTVTGTFYFYVGENGPVQNGSGYFAEFVDNLGTRVGVTNLVLMKTNAPNSKTDQLRGVGTGVFFPDDQGVLLTESGPMYMDITTGTVTKNADGSEKIKMTMKMAGGTLITGASGVWSGTANVTLTLATINNAD
jgi:hypothetical protein